MPQSRAADTDESFMVIMMMMDVEQNAKMQSRWRFDVCDGAGLGLNDVVGGLRGSNPVFFQLRSKKKKKKKASKPRHPLHIFTFPYFHIHHLAYT